MKTERWYSRPMNASKDGPHIPGSFLVEGPGGFVALNVPPSRVALVSAAPELLAALEGFVALVEDDRVMVSPGDRGALIALLTQANEAVAKAKGEA